MDDRERRGQSVRREVRRSEGADLSFLHEGVEGREVVELRNVQVVLVRVVEVDMIGAEPAAKWVRSAASSCTAIGCWFEPQ